ncbi:hypothetical protein Tco_0453722 [Tanacetum coccineum]
MQAEEQEKLSIEEKSKLFVQLLEARKKHFAAIRAKEMRNKPPTKAQKRNTMSTYLKNRTGYKHNQLKNKIFDDIQREFVNLWKEVINFVDYSQNCLMEVMPDEEEVALDAIPLAVKSPSILDWKIHKEGKKSYYQIIRADGSSKMLKAKYGSTRPMEDLNLVLYGDLKIMFEPHVEDNTTAKVTTINGEAQLHARVDGKKIIITESTMRRDLQLEDAEGVDCLPNATIFKQLILMRPKTTAWNEFSSTMASAIICLATNQKFNFSKLFFESIMKNLDNVSGKFLMYPRFVQVFLDQQLDDMSIHKRIYVASSHTKKVFANMRRVGKDFSDNVADKVVYKELDDSLVRAATIASSLEAEQDSGNIIKTWSKVTPNEAGVSTPQSDEDSMKLKELMEFCTKLQQRVLDLENTKTAQAQEITSLKLRVKKLEKKGGSRNHKLKRLYKVGRSTRVISSDETSLGDQEDASNQGRKINGIDKDAEITLVDETQGMYGDDLMFDTSVLDEKEVFAEQDMAEKDINVAEKEVSTADPVTTIGDVVTTASVEISTVSPTETIIIDDMTLAQTLIEIRSVKPKVKRVVIGEQSESTTRTRPQQLPSKDKGKAIMEEPKKPTKRKDQIRHDEEVAQRLQAQMQAKLEEEDRLQEDLSDAEKATLFVQFLEKRIKHFAAKRAKEKRNKPPTQAQQRKIMCTYLKNMEGKKPKDLKNKSFDSIQKMFDRAFKRVNTFVDFRTDLVEGSSKRAGEELEHENVKKQKVDDDKETAELKSLIEVMPDEEEVALDAIPLAVKSPSIVDWKIHKEGKKSYYQIIRADGSSKMYLVFSHMLKSFDREDLETLYKLVKAKYGSTRPVEDLDLVLYGDLKTMFEPHVEDNVWKNQSDYRVLDWKLYDSCGVHSLRKQNVHIHMLVEKRYPLTAPTITDILKRKLQADHCNEMRYQLLKLLTKQLKNQ